MTVGTTQSAEVYFRTYLYTTMPLHAAIVDEMSRSARPPLELATVLEDIGQGYQKMAEMLNTELIRNGRIDEEPEEFDDFAERRIAKFVERLLASAGPVELADGTQLDGRATLQASAAVSNAMTTAILLALGRRPRVRGGTSRKA